MFQTYVLLYTLFRRYSSLYYSCRGFTIHKINCDLLRYSKITDWPAHGLDTSRTAPSRKRARAAGTDVPHSARVVGPVAITPLVERHSPFCPATHKCGAGPVQSQAAGISDLNPTSVTISQKRRATSNALGPAKSSIDLASCSKFLLRNRPRGMDVDFLAAVLTGK